jgi:hypothetical protein
MTQESSPISMDYFPSRGMVENVGDSWIPMDPSFKQYEFTAGMNLKDQVPFDAEALANTIQTKATVNETEGWVQNVPQADIEAQLENFQAQLKTYIENHKSAGQPICTAESCPQGEAQDVPSENPIATVGEVLGLQEIKILPPRPLAAGLPYNRIITSHKTTGELFCTA